MKARVKVVYLIVILAVFPIMSAQAVDSEVILPGPSRGGQCIDVAPVGDGFGWNGSCSCEVGADSYGVFGFRFESSPSNLAIPSNLSGGGCTDSGAVSMFDITEDGPLQRQEIVFSDTERDDFGQLAVAVSEDYLAIVNRLGPNSTRLVNVYKKDENVWQKLYSLQDTENLYNSYWFGRSLHLHEDDLFVNANSLGIQRYRASDGALLQTFDHTDRPNTCTGLMITEGDLLFTSWSVCTATEGSDLAVLYERSASGEYVEVLRVETGFRARTNIVLGDDMLLLDIEGETVTYGKNPSGFWTELSRESATGLGREYHNGQLIEQRGNQLDISEYETGVGWSLQQTFGFSDSTGLVKYSVADNRITMLKTIVSHYHPPYVSSSFVNFSTQSVPEVSVYERDTSGFWTETYTDEFPGGGSQPIGFMESVGNNTFLTLSEGGFLNLYFNEDGSVQETTIPTTVAACDYSNADLYGGWGWNATTSESCAPLQDVLDTIEEMPSVAQCVDLDGDGYGWDGTASCVPMAGTPEASTDNNCDYSDADLYGGWGWDSSINQSCAPLNNEEDSVDQTEVLQCIDTDGDGYGWDGFSTCYLSN